VALVGAALWALGADGAHLWYDGALAPVYLGIVLLLAPWRGVDTLKSDATGQSYHLPVDGPPVNPQSAFDERGDLRPSSFGAGGRRTETYRPRNPQFSGRPAISIPVAIALGGLLAIGLLLKQHAVLALPGLVLALAWGRHAGRGTRIAAFVAALALPLLLVGLYYAFEGAASDAAYWIFAYAFDGNYAGTAGLAPSPDEWQWLAIAFAPALALLLAGAAVAPRVAWRSYSPLLLAGPWLLLATILPALPRYGRFHLQAAVPLLAVAAGAAVVALGYAYGVPSGGSDTTRRSRVLSVLAALLLLAYALGGLREGITSFSVQTTLGPVAAPYAATAPPLAAWVDAHTAPGAPIILYGVDPLVYRVVGHPPTTPWSPQLPWIMSVHNTYERVWAGVVGARPAVALVAASWWGDGELPSLEPGPGWLRTMYHEAARFQLVSYPGAPSLTVVALLLDNGKR
jgi:hypothetical protein